MYWKKREERISIPIMAKVTASIKPAFYMYEM